MKFTPKDIKGVVGIVPTPATADADKWTATNTVNLDEVSKMVSIIQDAGVDFLMTTGTFGECASLLADEVMSFVDCIIQTTRQKCPLFVGVTTLNTRETVARGREILAKFPVDGLFLGRPMWLPLDDQGILDYYRDLAEAFKGVPLIVYDNPFAFKGKISPAVYRELAKIPEIVAAKHTGGPSLYPDLEAVGDRISMLPIDSEWYEPAHKHPDQVIACWSGNVACGPEPVVALARAIAKRDWPLAKQITDRLEWSSAPMFPDGDLATFIPYSIQIGRARFKGAGMIDPGPSRPPYVYAPESMIAGGLEAGRRMRIVREEFTSKPVKRAI